MASLMPAILPETNPLPLEFLYRRYGYLSIDIGPAATPNLTIIPLSAQSSYRTVGLKPEDSGEGVKHLNHFISSTLSGQIPNDHCDLSKTSPPEKTFQQSCKQSIHNTVVFSEFPELSEDVLFTFTSTDNDSRKLVVHDPLTILEVARAGTALKLEAQMNHLLLSGSRFTLLYPRTWPLVPPSSNLPAIPIRDAAWEPDQEDFRAYMSRVRTLFHERPHIAAAAFSRGGIASRIAREVLGIEGSLDTFRNAHPEQGSSVIVRGKSLWYHKLHEGEWFYLVGGYEVPTGNGDQKRDMSWWPKVSIWEASNLNVGCWTPLCERWFQKRLQGIKDGTARPYSTPVWRENLRYEKHSKVFFRNWKNIGRDYLINECSIEKT